ncbi:MAG: MFS transporter [bacterium]|nr:MFS transporter [bacterium]
MELLPRFKHIFTSYAPEATTRSNVWNNIWDGFWWCVMLGFTQSFIGVFAISLGASDYMLGLLVSLPALVALIAQIPAAIITEKHHSRLKVVIPYGLLYRGSFLLFAIIPFLPFSPVNRAWIFIILLSVVNFPQTISAVAWSAMMGDIFPENLRGRIFSDRNMLLGIATLCCTLIAGPILDIVPSPYNFPVIFILSFCALMLSTKYLTKIIEKPKAIASTEMVKRGGHWGGIRKALHDRNFIFFTLSLFIIHIGFNVPAALWTIFHVKVLLLSKTFIGIIAVTSQIISVLSFRWWGRFADKYGNRTALWVSILIFMPQPFFHIFVVSGMGLVPLAMMNGLASAGFSMVLFNTLLEISPDGSIRPSYIAVFNASMGITGFLAPMIGIAIFQATSLAVVFSLASAIRLLGLVIMIKTVKGTLPSLKPLGFR